MKHEVATDETREQAALYALGALDGEEAQSFKHHLQEGCASCQSEVEGFKDVVGHLGFGAAAAQPPAGIRERLMARLTSSAGAPAESAPWVEAQAGTEEPGFLTVRAADNTWQQVAPGIKLRVLAMDPAQGRMTALARMEPGARHGPHRHTAVEENFVLEGNCYMAGRFLQVGDYHRAESGTVHHDGTYTTEGCLMLVILSPDNEMLESKG